MRARQAVAALGLLLVLGWSLSFALPTGELRDYGSFIASGRAGAQGENPYGIHPLTFHVVLPGFDVWNPNLNPPISVPVFAQFDRVPPHAGFRLWWWFSLVCYAAALLLLARHHRRRLSPLLLLWAAALAGFWDTLALGQIYLPLVLATVGSWILLDRGRWISAGVLMGIVVAVKPNFAVWPGLLLLAGHWRVAVSAGVTVLAISAIPLSTHGTVIYAQWIELILEDRSRTAFLTNASMPGLAARGGLGFGGAVISLGILAALAAWALRRRPDPLAVSALGIVGGIAASPLAWVHYTLFLLPAFFAWRLGAPLIAAAALMTVPVPLLLRFLDAPWWQQITIGSSYNWAVLLAVIGFSSVVRRPAAAAEGVTLVFYDGMCGLCDRFIHFLLVRDRAARLRFAPLQGELAQRVLVPAGHDPTQLDSVLVATNWGSPQQAVLARSEAVIHTLARLGGPWGVLADVADSVPHRIADALYAFVARKRYSVFGQFDACPLPRPEWRDRFVDTVTR